MAKKKLLVLGNFYLFWTSGRPLSSTTENTVLLRRSSVKSQCINFVINEEGKYSCHLKIAKVIESAGAIR